MVHFILLLLKNYEYFSKINVFIDLKGLSLNLDTIDFLKIKNKNGKISFMIYNNVFWNFYHKVMEKKNLHLMWLIFSFILLFVSGCVIYMSYVLINNHK